MNVLCQIFGHKFRTGWAGAYGGPFGAVVVNLKTCDRCDHCEKEFSTAVWAGDDFEKCLATAIQSRGEVKTE